MQISKGQEVVGGVEVVQTLRWRWRWCRGAGAGAGAGAEVQRCRGAEVQWCSGAEVQRSRGPGLEVGVEVQGVQIQVQRCRQEGAMRGC